jgi:riboflavin-specific deaminase-like protein
MEIAEVSGWGGPGWSAILAAARGEAVAESALWPIYGPLLTARSCPLVFGQMGQSLDGRVATANGHSQYVNGPAALTHLHRLRALSDAVVIGVGTALADDPQLTVRHSDGADPMRVILDPRGRLPADARCLRPNGAQRVVVSSAPGDVHAGIEQIVLPVIDGAFAPHALVEALAARGCKRILIEGGPTTLSRFIAAGVLDRLHLMIAPMIIGSGLSALKLPPIDRLDASLRPATRVFRLPDGDLLCDCDLRS